MRIFSIRLKELRTDRSLTQDDLAKIMHVGRPTIAGYETKNKQPDYEKLVFLANYFNVTTDYLLGLSDIKSPKKIVTTAPSPIHSLASDQKALLALYDALSDRGQGALLERAKIMVETETQEGTELVYKKDGA